MNNKNFPCNYIVFSDEFGRHPSSCEHIVKYLLQEYGVLWVNTIGMRSPRLNIYDFKRSLQKIFTWLTEAFKEKEIINRNLVVLNPIMLPFNNSRIVRKFNKLLVVSCVKKKISNLKIENLVVVASVTNVSDFVSSFNANAIVYYCVDEYVEWPGSDKNLIIEMEEELLKVSDLVFATADELCRKKERNNKRPIYLPHGVDFDHFNIDRKSTKGSLLQNIKAPIIGFFGAVSSWLDLELLAYAAKSKPEWSIVLLGPVDSDVKVLSEYKNIHLLGKVPYHELPSQAAAFDVALIPFQVNELTISVNPLKLIEYLAMGLPVVSTPLPEVEKFKELVYVARNEKAFVEAIDLALSEDSPELVQQRKNIAKKYSWSSIAKKFVECINSCTNRD